MLVRLQKFLAEAGLGSRRYCETLITGGQVGVNGQPVTVLGAKVDSGKDRVTVAGQPVSIGGVTVASGDYAIADASGVVFVPAADIERLLQAAEMIAAREAAMTKALLAGKPITEVMGADYEHMLK